ncbi:MAG TPA: hypothetical protein VF161_05455 [Steroidobacteraceae bacterium]
MQAQPSMAGSQDPPGFAEYLGILRKRRRLLLLVAVPIALLGAVLAVVLPDVYRSTGLIEIEGAESLRDTGTLRSVVARESDEPLYADQYVQSLSTQVLGDKSLRQLLSEHELYDDQKQNLSAAVRRLRSDIDVDIVTVPILDPQSGREREVVTAFTVSYDNRDPQRAQEGAAWLVEAFMEANRRDRQADAASAAKFYAAEAERMRLHVANLEAKLAEFKARHAGQTPDMAEMNMQVLDRTENEIQNVEAQLQALRRERVFLAAQLQQARAAVPETQSLRQLEEQYRRMSATYDESHPDLVSLRRQIEALRSGASTAGMSLREQLRMQRSILAEARQRYSEDHPDVKRILRNIESLEARIASGENPDRAPGYNSPMAVQLETQLNATDTQLAALQARAAELRAKREELEQRITTAPQVEREFQVVTRDLASARAKYEELLKRQMDAEVSEAAIAGGTADKFRVKQAPSTPERPAKPPRLAMFLVAVVLGTILGVTAVVLAQLLDQTVRGIRDVRDILDVTPLSAVPVIQKRRGLRRRFGFAHATGAVVVLAIGAYAASQLIGA